MKTYLTPLFVCSMCVCLPATASAEENLAAGPCAGTPDFQQCEWCAEDEFGNCRDQGGTIEECQDYYDAIMEIDCDGKPKRNQTSADFTREFELDY